MKLSKVYRYGFLSLFRMMILFLLESILIILLIITAPIWWLKCIQNFLTIFGDLIEKVIYY